MKLFKKVIISLLFIFLSSVFIYHTWFEKPYSAYTIKSPKLREISGLQSSIKNKNLLWVHNDGSKFVRLYLIDRKGNVQGVFKKNIEIKNWEALALDPGLSSGKPFIYVGDIGDNSANRAAIKIVRFPEPQLGDSAEIKAASSFYLKYPDGKRDAEAMFIDPLSKKLHIVSKREEQVGIYTTPLNVREGDTVVMKKTMNLNLHGVPMFKWVTDADISKDGLQILIRSYGHVFYWKRSPNQTIEQALAEEPYVLPHASEIQGEAIGFSLDKTGYYTISEGKHPSLNYNVINLD